MNVRIIAAMIVLYNHLDCHVLVPCFLPFTTLGLWVQRVFSLARSLGHGAKALTSVEVIPILSNEIQH